MMTVDLRVTHPTGLHARPAALFVQTAARYQARLLVTNLDRDPDRAVDAKSILSLMTLGVRTGQTIRVSADGTDAGEAIAALSQLVAADFAPPAA